MRVRRSALVGAWLLATLLPVTGPARAQGTFVLMNDRNHPELRWLELRTEHFRIFYHDPLEVWAREAASILERYHRPLCRRLDVSPQQRTRVYLSDQDQIANGAAVGWDYFFVWIPSHVSHRSFAGGRAWFEEVLVHEYAHILVSEASRSWLGTLAFPLGLYPPRWLHEGVAQWVAEPWSVLRGDRTVASAILDGSLDRNPPGVPGRARLLHYARGHARIRWLAEAYGDSIPARLARASGPLGLYTYRSARRAALGKEASRWSARFRREMIAFYGDRFRDGEPPDSLGPRLEIDLAYPSRVAAAGESLYWAVGQEKRGPRESSLFRKVGRRAPERMIAGGVIGSPLPLPDGRVVVTRMHRVAHGSWVEDLALWDPATGEERFITSGERTAEPSRLAGDRLVALVDTRQGMALAQSPLPGPRSPCTFTTLRRWPRGTILHGLAASPEGSRLIVSQTDPDGRRSLLGLTVGLVQADTTRLMSNSAETRDTVWLDRERIAWTSHAGGLANVWSGSWPWGGRLLEAKPRTALGTSAQLAGTERDSILVLDRTSRLSFGLRRCDANRPPRRSPDGPAYPFAARAAVEPDRTVPRIDGPYPYRALDEVRPWFRIPLLGPQAGEPAIGFAGLWAEPLLRHAFGGYVYTSPEQAEHPDRGLFYVTTRFGPWLAAFHSSSIVARRLLQDRILFERRETTGLALLSPLHASSDPLLSGWADAFVRTDSRRPRFGGRSLQTPLGRPQAWSSLQVGGGIGVVRIPSYARGAIGPREGWGAEVRLQGGLAASVAATRFVRGTARTFHAKPLPMAATPTLWIEARFEGASGGLPPQEFIGLDADPSHRLIAGWPGLDGTVFLRGWPRARAARYVLYVNAEARLRVVPDLGIRGPGLGIHGGTIAPFLEAAHPWGGRSAGLFEERTRIAAGIEGRFAARIGGLPVVAALAWGEPVGHEGPNGSWSWRLTTALPFSIPLRPPAMLRTLLGGSLQSDSWGSTPPLSH